MMTGMFEGKVALVTGGSSGIGRATALAFAAQGACVVVASRREEESAQTVREIAAAGGQALFVRTDVTQSAQVQALVARAVAEYGGLDYAFNNAGIEGTPFVPLQHYGEEAWDEVVAINAKGVFLSLKYELPACRGSQGRDRQHGLDCWAQGQPLRRHAYVASKHAVVGVNQGPGAGVRRQRGASQCRGAGDHPHPDGRARFLPGPGDPRARSGHSPARSRRHARRGRAGGDLAVQSGVVVHHRPHVANRRRRAGLIRWARR